MKKVERQLHKIDASGQSLGRLATQVALILRGKNKPDFDPSQDTGDIVEILNMNAVKLSGNKMEQKKYFSYSGYPGGLKTALLKDVFANNPGDVLKRAVRKMLPENRLRARMLKRLIIR
jgi:large subunit ribosomal protein L13